MPADRQTATDALRDEITKARIDFGKNLARWRRRNNWSQDTAEQWGKAADFPYVHNSQWSRMERGLHTMPGPLLFRCLGIMNSRIAAEQWGSIASTVLRDRVQGAQAIRDGDSGEPWQGADFYAAFIGQKAWPDLPRRQPLMTAAEAEAWNRQLRLWFEEITTAAHLLPLAALQGLMEQVPAEQQGNLQQALMGMGGFTAGELQRLMGGDGLEVQQWLETWARSLGVDLVLELGLHWRLVPQGPQDEEEDKA